MRKIVLVLAGCLALTGCTFAWEGEIRFKVTKIDEHYQAYNAAPEETVVQAARCCPNFAISVTKDGEKLV